MSSEGINPDTFGDNDQDISQAKAGQGLFEDANNPLTFSISTEDIFNEVESETSYQEEGASLFEKVVEHRYTQEDSYPESGGSIFWLILLCIAIGIITYGYYRLQRKWLRKEIMEGKVWSREMK